ncbi:hypothetical protein [Streptomyces sp. NPDC051921]|uniref:hypothetical protein n=1 Tax=Streptomyces sp. NPDC051921 TaxID=3155806 RepID=UPI00343292B5
MNRVTDPPPVPGARAARARAHASPVPATVFRARGVTPEAAGTGSRPPFPITHAPGRVLVPDVRDAEHRVPA